VSQTRDLRVNRQIRIAQVLVIDDEGTQLGVMPTAEAMRLAAEKGLDLVEVQPQVVPPVTRLMDYGRYRYEQERRAREARRSAPPSAVKEVKLRPKIGRGDLATKARRASEFLAEGHKVKLVVQFRGREITHPELGHRLIADFLTLVADVGASEREARLEGKFLSTIVAPTRPAAKAA
jgi:translation initiation factor IF-3